MREMHKRKHEGDDLRIMTCAMEVVDQNVERFSCFTKCMLVFCVRVAGLYREKGQSATGLA
ncbi:hypothetical protein PsorP6_006303 [Peronosclerospora sorghi]|uniref:Uncharacterized protein n=1 Tax=Peronosclerospora sorghi TaxID=230839 RepID=A0ACC0W564_9STRA|nr:hypothetical protein PsorP6_006303 [Peronosclerospora sorghi]